MDFRHIVFWLYFGCIFDIQPTNNIPEVAILKRKINCDLILFSIGGAGYGIIEILWRKYTHWSMILTGGTCFLLLYKIFKKIVDHALWKKCIIGSGVITSVEFFVGCIVNIKLKLKVWDYSNIPVNFCGQVCLLYSFLWGLLTIPIVGLCTVIRKKYKF